MPWFVIHFQKWLLQFGHLHVVSVNYLPVSWKPLFIIILNSHTILLMYTLSSVGERPHPCHTHLFNWTVAGIVSSLNLVLTFISP
jgi:hypothetical protein